MSKYPVIIFEGVEVSGKSTYIEIVSKYLKKIGKKYIKIREPGGAKYWEIIRNLILNKNSKLNYKTDLFLILASRSENFDKILKNNYRKKIILIDRFTDSTLAYQHYGMGINKFLINQINRFIINKFKSAIVQEVTQQQIIHLDIANKKTEDNENAKEEKKDNSIYTYEPDEASILQDLLPKNVSIQIFKILLESNAGEQGARMAAMDNATRNAGEMIDGFTLKYNRTRQAFITKELIEIISGAESV